MFEASPKSTRESNSKEKSMSSRIESLTIQEEDVKEDEAEDEEGLPIYPSRLILQLKLM